jgi:hypothetical protein
VAARYERAADRAARSWGRRGPTLADPDRMARSSRTLLAQGLYYVATGLWPLLHLRSFERVTGPKYEIWLVRTVGALATAIGFTLLRSWRRPSRDAAVLSTASAIAFAAIDLGYAARGRISPVYFADAATELGFVAARAR